MTDDPEAPLRDRLASERTDLARTRTALANERTLLAYLRTALALVAGSVALLQLVDATWALLAGWTALPLSLLVLTAGVLRFQSVRRRLRAGG